MYIYRCEESMEGILTAIYNIYEDKRAFADTQIRLDDEYILFGEDVAVQGDCEKAEKVSRTLYRKFGPEDYDTICKALASWSPDKANVVFHSIRYGLSASVAPGRLFQHLSDDNVLQVSKLALNAAREFQHLQGFVRFEELENGILFSRIKPRNHVLQGLMEHFSDRFPMENFCIYDEGREQFAIHPAGKAWFLLQGDVAVKQVEYIPHSTEEEKYAALFRHFCNRITIEERSNYELQRNMLPIRFREYMTEFK